MNLYDICKKVAEIEEGLTYGEIQFEYNKLMCARKPGHPADLLDDILSQIGWVVFGGKDVSLERVKEWVRDFKAFKTSFKIKQLSAPIKHAQEYIKEMEGKDNG